MSLPPAPAPLTDADYDAIVAAVLETARGRWFLAEHARRNRHADTQLVLKAIQRLEETIVQRENAVESDRLRLNLVDMMNAIMRTKSEIAAVKPDGGQIGAAGELDAIVGTTEKATSDILAAAERIQEIAWTMREQGIEPSICDLIDTHTTEVYTACSFQDLTGQRIRKVIEVMRFLEARIDAMIKIWRLDDLEMIPVDETSGTPLRAPAIREGGLQQQAIDELLGNDREGDVLWRDAEGSEARTPRRSDDVDLDDLDVFEAPEEPLPTSVAEAPAQHSPAAKPSEKAKPDARGDGIDALAPAERLALFS